jgi:hypothetical protein
MSLKIGDKIRVHTKEWMNTLTKDRSGNIRYGDLKGTLTPVMQGYAGKIVTIGHKNFSGSYRIVENRSESWREWMFEDFNPLLYQKYELGNHDAIIIQGDRYLIDSDQGRYFIYQARDWDAFKTFADGISLDRVEWSNSVLGYYDVGVFPFCKSIEDLTTLVLDLASMSHELKFTIEIVKNLQKDA